MNSGMKSLIGMKAGDFIESGRKGLRGIQLGKGHVMKVWLALGISAVMAIPTGCVVHETRTRRVYVPPPPPPPPRVVYVPAPTTYEPPPPVAYEPPPPPVAYEPPPAYEVRATAGITVSYFEEPLAPYGDWVVIPSYGRCWIPRGMEPGWRPYTHGHWVYTDDGMLWVSDYPWGWAPFHYGRWFWSDDYGWAWVPGTVWAPNWCAWRWSDDYAVWAPLPPTIGARLDFGDLDIDLYIRPSWWIACQTRYFFAPAVHRHCEPFSRNVTIIHKTRHVTKYEIHNTYVRNVSVHNHREVERVVGHRVEKRRIVDSDSPRDRGERDHDVRTFRPGWDGKRAARIDARGERRETPEGRPLPGERPTVRREEMRVQPPVYKDPVRDAEERARKTQDWEKEQRQATEKRHQDERRRPANVSQEELVRRQDEEKRLLEEETRRERAATQRKLERIRESEKKAPAREDSRGPGRAVPGPKPQVQPRGVPGRGPQPPVQPPVQPREMPGRGTQPPVQPREMPGRDGRGPGEDARNDERVTPSKAIAKMPRAERGEASALSRVEKAISDDSAHDRPARKEASNSARREKKSEPKREESKKKDGRKA